MMNNWPLKLSVFLGISVVVDSRLIALVDDKYEDCTEGGKAQYIDYSGVEFDYFNDTTFVLTGEVKWLKTVKNPMKVYYFIEKFERLQWHKAIVDRHIPDFCQVVQDKREPWYLLTSQFEQKLCPFEAGHVEKFNNNELPDLVPPGTPFTFAGKYRVFLYSYFAKEDGGTHTDCLKLGFELTEV